MRVCVPVMPSGEVDPRWGRAARMAVAEVREGRIIRWDEVDVAWDVLHDAGTEGAQHARVARFLQEWGVEAVVAHHMGDPMRVMLERMRLEVHLGAAADARAAVIAATTGRAA